MHLFHLQAIDNTDRNWLVYKVSIQSFPGSTWPIINNLGNKININVTLGLIITAWKKRSNVDSGHIIYTKYTLHILNILYITGNVQCNWDSINQTLPQPYNNHNTNSYVVTISMEQSHPENVTVVWLVMKFSAFYVTWKFITFIPIIYGHHHHHFKV